MKLSELNYHLPQNRIALTPPAERDGARLMHVARSGLHDMQVLDLPALVEPGTLVVLNNTRVIPARLLGKKLTTGGKAEIFLLQDISSPGEPDTWIAMGRASKGLAESTVIAFGDDAQLHGRIGASAAERGTFRVHFTHTHGALVQDALRAEGRMPLPPYIARDATASDAERYQTVFAKHDGAVAAPTAGLHVSERLMAALRARGCEFAEVTLHVGAGTFKTVTAEDLDNHPMHSERYEVGEETALAVRTARAEGRPVLAVGTTAVRALESAAARTGEVAASSGETRLLIQPGYAFKAVDRMLTNFHLPESTLLALVYAFAGTERMRAAYTHAIGAQYMFYSYGDAMLLQREGT